MVSKFDLISLVIQTEFAEQGALVSAVSGGMGVYYLACKSGQS